MTRKIPLSKGKFASVDDCDYERVAQIKWHALWDGWNWYAVAHSPTQNGKRDGIRMHRLILDAPMDMLVDHCDGDGLNNQRSNLRLCSHAKNMRNSQNRSNNKSGYRGVSWNKKEKRWHAQIKVDGKVMHLGWFVSPEIAALAYDAAAKKYHGDFAVTNEKKMKEVQNGKVAV